MRRINPAAAVLVVVGWPFATPAVGQNDCSASFAVNPAKSVTYLSIGPNAGDRIDGKMSCPVAEKMRDEFFLTGRTIDRDILGDTNRLRSKIMEIKGRLDHGKSELDAATSEAAHLSALLNLKEAVLAAGVASATTGCIVSAQTCKPAVGASFALYQLANSDSRGGGLTQARAQVQRDIGTLDSMLQSIQPKLNDNVARESRMRFDVVLSEMCKAIKQQCR
jgi:hypothetical protein